MLCFCRLLDTDVESPLLSLGKPNFPDFYLNKHAAQCAFKMQMMWVVLKSVRLRLQAEYWEFVKTNRYLLQQFGHLWLDRVDNTVWNESYSISHECLVYRRDTNKMKFIILRTAPYLWFLPLFLLATITFWTTSIAET